MGSVQTRYRSHLHALQRFLFFLSAHESHNRRVKLNIKGTYYSNVNWNRRLCVSLILLKHQEGCTLESSNEMLLIGKIRNFFWIRMYCVTYLRTANRAVETWFSVQIEMCGATVYHWSRTKGFQRWCSLQWIVIHFLHSLFAVADMGFWNHCITFCRKFKGAECRSQRSTFK